MKRFIMDKLVAWKNSTSRKPLILQGARQVGKTWVLKTFATENYSQTAYVNFMFDETLKHIFEGDLESKRLLEAISLSANVEEINADTLVILDEIQECPRALTSLKMFAESRPDLHIASAGSLLGVALHRGTSYPVGKVDHLFMYPMTFEEFLIETHPSLYKPLENINVDLLNGYSEKYISALKAYYFVGGMPAAVSAYTNEQSFLKVRDIQNAILFDYENDFSKYANPLLSEKIRLVWNSTAMQLGKENKKFIYSAVKPSARARGYEEAIQWLCDAGLTLKVMRVAKAGLPLKSYCEADAFKIYLLDVGLLGAMCKTAVASIIEGNTLFTEFKGALSENYVCQELMAMQKSVPYYWSAENSSGEVDFIIECNESVLPIEVKAETNLQAKSLKSFVKKYELPFGVRLSLSGYEKQNRLVNVPLYATSRLINLL